MKSIWHKRDNEDYLERCSVVSRQKKRLPKPSYPKFHQLFRNYADQNPCFKTNAGARFDLNDSPKIILRHRLSDCVIVAEEGTDLRTDLFTERLGFPAVRHESIAQLTPLEPKLKSEAEIHLIAASGDIPMVDLLAVAHPRKNATTGSNIQYNDALCILKWNALSRPSKTTAIDVDNLLSLVFSGARCAPEGLLGWGFTKVVDALDGSRDPVRMLTHLTRALRHLHIETSRLELAKAAIANLAQGASANKITVATDGDGFLVELEFEALTSSHETATKLAGWLDRTANPNGEPCLGWVQNQREGTLTAGIILGASQIPVGLILDETDPIVEPKAQTSYNVA